MKKTQEIIECPNCQVLQLAEIWQEERPFAIYIHNCESCGHLIMESEWNSVSAADVMAHITALHTQLARTWQPITDDNTELIDPSADDDRRLYIDDSGTGIEFTCDSGELEGYFCLPPGYAICKLVQP